MRVLHYSKVLRQVTKIIVIHLHSILYPVTQDNAGEVDAPRSCASVRGEGCRCSRSISWNHESLLTKFTSEDTWLLHTGASATQAHVATISLIEGDRKLPEMLSTFTLILSEMSHHTANPPETLGTHTSGAQ